MAGSIDVDGTLKLRNPAMRVIPLPSKLIVTNANDTVAKSHHFEGRRDDDEEGANCALQAA
jgi:hypothetical protein